MKLSKALQKYRENAENREGFLVEQAKLGFALALEKQRRKKRLTYSALAKKLGTSGAYITKVFRGDTNLTIESLVRLCRAADARLVVSVESNKVDAKQWAWAGIAEAGQQANDARYWVTPTAPTATIEQRTMEVACG